jgi:hypothetical protein
VKEGDCSIGSVLWGPQNRITDLCISFCFTCHQWLLEWRWKLGTFICMTWLCNVLSTDSVVTSGELILLRVLVWRNDPDFISVALWSLNLPGEFTFTSLLSPLFIVSVLALCALTCFIALNPHCSIVPVPCLTGPEAPEPAKSSGPLPLWVLRANSLSLSFLRDTVTLRLILWLALTNWIWWKRYCGSPGLDLSLHLSDWALLWKERGATTPWRGIEGGWER